MAGTGNQCRTSPRRGYTTHIAQQSVPNVNRCINDARMDPGSRDHVIACALEAAGVFIAQLTVIEPKLMQYAREHVRDAERILDGCVADLISRTVDEASPETTACQDE